MAVVEYVWTGASIHGYYISPIIFEETGVELRPVRIQRLIVFRGELG